MHSDAGKVTGFPHRLKQTIFRILFLISKFSFHRALFKSISGFLVFLTFSFYPCSGKNGVSEPDSAKSSFALFDSDELLEVALQFDLTTYLKKNLKTGSLDGLLIIKTSETDSIDRKVKIKPRGEYRFRTCGFPPIRLDFKKWIYADPDSGKIKRLKLVTHCQPGNAYDEYVLREFLVYKLFNVFTDTCFRVRLLRINYLDSGKDRKPLVQYGFFIEPINILAARTKSGVTKATNLSQKHIVPCSMDRVAIFNYMIAQWDWAVPGLHNISVIIPRENSGMGLGVAIPFDFDLTGLVNASYGFPDEKMGITSNRDRIFTGICRSREEYKAAIEKFLARKESFYSVVNDFQYLSDRSKKDIKSFLDQFFDQLDNQKDLNRLIELFLNSCKKI